MNLEEYIKNLPPELQEKARKCANIEEILALAEGEDIQLPEEVLETIAGGKKRDPRNCGKTKCPNCGSTDIKVVRNELYFYVCKCNDCGTEFRTSHVV